MKIKLDQEGRYCSYSEPEQPRQPENKQEHSTLGEGGIVDKLQAAVYNSGEQVISTLKEKRLANEKNEGFKQAQVALQELGHFCYNIGFAGEQSCGKSTVINSLLRYPMMPTSQLTTTATVVKLSYSEHLRIQAKDEDSGKTVLDYDCVMPQGAQEVFRERFAKLLDYGVEAMNKLVMETFQAFTDVNVLDSSDLKPADMDLVPENPRHVMFLLLVLLAVYVGQNDSSWGADTKALMDKRAELLGMLGIPQNTVNISVHAKADFEVLKSGLVITDLPGLGSNAGNQVVDGRKVKGHDEITKKAIQECDAMVFLGTPENRHAGYDALREMLTNAKIKQAVYKGNRIIAVLNQADRCGVAQLKNALKDFCTALDAVGVNKKPEEILTYSGIAGEYKFEEVPFQRTLLYNREYREADLRADAEANGDSFEELKSDEVARLKRQLKRSYDSSGIEKLLNLFRTDYVEQGKYIKSTNALQALRELVVGSVNTLEQIAKNCDLLCNTHNALQSDMMEKVKIAVEKPLAEAQEKINKEISRTSKDMETDLGYYTQEVPQLYINAFDTGLTAYKQDLLNCMNGFRLTYVGLGSRARIDQAGSQNRRIYLDLQDKMKALPVSLTEVNIQYEKILDIVRGKIDRFYEDALDGFSGLSEATKFSLDGVIQEARKSSISEKEIEALKILRDQMVEFIEKQLGLVGTQFSRHQNATTDAMSKVVQKIFDLNDQMVGQFTTSSLTALKKKVAPGGIFVAKEFVMVDGADGLKTEVGQMRLTEEERQIIAGNVDAGVNAIVHNEITTWINDLYVIATAYATLQSQIQVPLEDMISSMGKSAQENADKAESVRKQIEEWKNVTTHLNGSVCSVLEEACAHLDDREPINNQMKKNVFFGCFA